MTRRTASLAFVCLLNGLPLYAQGAPHPNAGGNGGGNGNGNAALEAAVAALQDRVAKLEGNITEDDIPGDYVLNVIDVTLSGAIQGQRPATIGTSGAHARVTLIAGGTGTFTSGTCGEATLTQGTWLFSSNTSCDNGLNALTWSYSGGTLTLDLPNGDGTSDHIPLDAAAGGRLFIISAPAVHAGDQSSDEITFILTRLL